MRKAVVTGACGFIGKELTRNLLNKGIIVYAIVTNPTRLDDLKCESLILVKLFFEEYFELINTLPSDVDVFYHFAWSGVYGDAFKDYELQLKNVKFTADAIMIASRIGARKFVLASTINTLETRHYLAMDYFEPRYTNIYATSKLAADLICKTIAYNNKIEYNSGLISMVYGEGNRSKMVTNIVISNLLNNKPSNLIDGNTIYDIIHVSEVAEAFYHIGLEGKNMKTYYVGHRNLRTFKTIFDDIKDLINRAGVINYGVYDSVSAIDFNLVDVNALTIDTTFKEEDNFNENMIKTINWIKESEGLL